MRETLFNWPGRYALWRQEGVLRLAMETGCSHARRRFEREVTPGQGYRFLMARRRTELLYALAEAMAAAGALDEASFASLVEICATGDEDVLCALADRWNESGVVAASLDALLGTVPASWFAPVTRRNHSSTP